MKELLVLRHAQAVSSGGPGGDFGRRLSDKGARDAHAAGNAIVTSRRVPEQIVTSPAARTLETARRCAERIERLSGAAVPVREDARIYEASAGDLLEIVRGLDPRFFRIMLVGHNPGVERLVELLIDPEAPGPSFSRMSPCTLAVLRLECESWRDAGPDCGALIDLVMP